MPLTYYDGRAFRNYLRALAERDANRIYDEICSRRQLETTDPPPTNEANARKESENMTQTRSDWIPIKTKRSWPGETPGYEALARVLGQAYTQAAAGKGHDRHAYGEPFHEQDICTEARTLGLAAPAFQARKKIKEALRLVERCGPAAAIPDLLGAINYTAALVIEIERRLAEDNCKDPKDPEEEPGPA